jgi:hypothetical protein
MITYLHLFFFNLPTYPSSSSSSSFSPLAWILAEEEDFLTWLGIYVLHNLLLLFTGFQASDWPSPHLSQCINSPSFSFVGFAYQGKDIVFRFIVEYSSLRDFGPLVIIIGLFLYEDFWKLIFWLVLNLEISYKVRISWTVLVSFRGFFWRLYFCMVKYLNFHNFSFALKYF